MYYNVFKVKDMKIRSKKTIKRNVFLTIFKARTCSQLFFYIFPGLTHSFRNPEATYAEDREYKYEDVNTDPFPNAPAASYINPFYTETEDMGISR